MVRRNTSAVEPGMMPWVGHLAELRNRLVRSAIVLILGCVAGWYAAPRALDLLRKPVGHLVFVAPAEALMAYLQITLALGLLLASPYVLAEAWLFVRPGLLKHEQKAARKIVPLAYLFFIAGGAVGYKVLFPLGVQTLLQLASGPVRPAVAVGRYLEVFWSTVLPCAVAFELPLAVVTLVAAGVIDLEWLRAQRSLALLLSFVLGGVLSPQGVMMQFLLAIPLFCLFELGVGLASLLRVNRTTVIE